MEKTRILVVDDEKIICDVTKNFLTKHNYDVSEAYTVGEAIEKARQVSPHVVLLDIRLGSESGMEVLREIKRIDKKTKVIMVTALEDQQYMREAKSLGVDDYVIKPFTAAYLRDIILQKISHLSTQEGVQQ